MGKKNLVVIGILLIVLIVTAGIAYQNSEYVKQAKKQVDSLNALVQQKDIEIAKLTKEIKAKQDEFSGIQSELDKTKKALDVANAQVNKVVVSEKNEK